MSYLVLTHDHACDLLGPARLSDDRKWVNLSTRVKVDQAQTIVARYSQLLDVIRVIARRRKVPRTVATRLAASLRTLTSSGRLLERPWAGGMTGQRQRP